MVAQQEQPPVRHLHVVRSGCRVHFAAHHIRFVDRLPVHRDPISVAHHVIAAHPDDPLQDRSALIAIGHIDEYDITPAYLARVDALDDQPLARAVRGLHRLAHDGGPLVIREEVPDAPQRQHQPERHQYPGRDSQGFPAAHSRCCMNTPSLEPPETGRTSRG